MSTEQALLGLGAATTLLALWAAIFATRADRAVRRAQALADSRWDDGVRPLPRFTFAATPAPGQSVEVEVENLGGMLAASAIIVQHGDDVFAGELTLPAKAAPRRILLAPVMKAWQKAGRPSCLLVAGRDMSGKWWDCLEGGKVVKDPALWLAGQLQELRLEGVIDFPSLSAPVKT